MLAGQDPVQTFLLIALREFEDFFDTVQHTVAELVEQFVVDEHTDPSQQLSFSASPVG